MTTPEPDWFTKRVQPWEARPVVRSLLARLLPLPGEGRGGLFGSLLDAPPSDAECLRVLAYRAALDYADERGKVQRARKPGRAFVRLVDSARFTLALAAVARYAATESDLDRQWAEWLLAAVEAPHGIGHAWEKEARE